MQDEESYRDQSLEGHVGSTCVLKRVTEVGFDGGRSASEGEERKEKVAEGENLGQEVRAKNARTFRVIASKRGS